MEIMDILTKYGRSTKSAADPPAPLLPPIDQSNNHMLPLLPTTPRHAKPSAARSKPKAKAPVVPHYFVRSTSRDPTVVDKSLVSTSVAADVPRGELESWPLGASGRGKPHQDTDHDVKHRRHKDDQRGAQPAKPAFLQHLEAFVVRELNVLGMSPSPACVGDNSSLPPRLARLQVFRECFLRLIDDFKTYKPLLLAIKQEYEGLLDMYELRVSMIPQYEATIQTMEQEAQQAIAEHNLVNKMKVKEWKKQLKSTQATLAAYAAANATLTDTTSKLTTEVSDAVAKVADLMATNQALLHTMMRQDDRQKEHDSHMSDLHATVHSLTAKYARAQDEILELRNSIVTLEDKAGGIDVNADRRTIEHLTREVQDLMAYRVAHEKPPHKVPVFDEATFVAKVVAEWQTSVPDCVLPTEPAITSISALVQAWKMCCNAAVAPQPVSSSPAKPPTTPATTTTDTPATSVFITGLIPDERNERVDVLPDIGDYFVGRGTGDAVPDYLQYEGHVRNKFYSKRDTERIISDVWLQKATAEKLIVRDPPPPHGTNARRTTNGSSNSQRMTTARKSSVSTTVPPTAGATASPCCIPLRQYFHTYLTKKFPVRTDAIECTTSPLKIPFDAPVITSNILGGSMATNGVPPGAYNLCAALEQYQYDSECRIFQLILDGDIPEDARADQLRVVYAVYEAFVALDKNEYVAVGPALRELHILFPWKSDESMAALSRALLMEAKGQPHLNYTTLLEQDRNGNQSTFCECIRSQHLDELTTLKRSLLRELQVEERCAGPDNNGMISLDAVRRVIRRCDPSRPAAAVNVLMVECTNLPLDRVESETSTLINAHGVRSKLASMLIKPAGKLPVLP
ncbi:hypothetical protein H310_08478 [Aphanomyces invadans]|uniref:Translin-associated factor X-interacting protein 1 N-terminal domain-containing protein n=1 Tax=Aphanomyces invadans TaxID=157072 RepID=A0A024TXX1_9STRA|nr:hypothetical protein H310_08478 [Aphanomyces invadans]ETV99005.1 hypothetical protein H310_08478 [Aphanomyces invadans]|eukprot:XP_008872433.1 hypothetical protein H310_08478 [Aphanomyces invadans]